MRTRSSDGKILNKGVLIAGIAGAALIALRVVQLVAAGAVLSIKKYREGHQDKA